MAGEPTIDFGQGWTGTLQVMANGQLGLDIGFSGTPKVSELNCDNTGVTDTGIFSVARIRTAITMAAAAMNTYTAYKMARLSEDIADKYARLAESAKKYYDESYRPVELQNIREVENLSKYDRSKLPTITGEMLVSARNKFVGGIDQKLSCTGRYCTGQRAAMLQDMLLEQAAVEATVAGLAHRYVDAEEIARDTLRWERRKAVLDLGRGIPGEATSYAELAAGLFGSIGDQAAKGAEGAARYGSWLLNRRPTVYNPDRPPLQKTVREFIQPTKPEATKPSSVYVPEQPKEPKITG